MLAAYCCDAATGETTVEDLAKSYLDRDIPRTKELLGSGRKARVLGDLGQDELDHYLATHAHYLMPLKEVLSGRMAELGVDRLFYEVETPLLYVLSTMEAIGVLVDPDVLLTISKDIDVQMKGMEERIYAHAGRSFNINSPKQLGEILFVDLNLPMVKKTKTGFSTDSAVLEALAPRHELPAIILDWRMLTKLKNTYVDTLPTMIDPTDRACPYTVQPGRHSHGQDIVFRAQSPEHPHTLGHGQAYPVRLQGTQGLFHPECGLFPDRAEDTRPYNQGRHPHGVL